MVCLSCTQQQPKAPSNDTAGRAHPCLCCIESPEKENEPLRQNIPTRLQTEPQPVKIKIEQPDDLGAGNNAQQRQAAAPQQAYTSPFRPHEGNGGEPPQATARQQAHASPPRSHEGNGGEPPQATARQQVHASPPRPHEGNGGEPPAPPDEASPGTAAAAAAAAAAAGEDAHCHRASSLLAEDGGEEEKEAAQEPPQEGAALPEVRRPPVLASSPVAQRWIREESVDNESNVSGKSIAVRVGSKRLTGKVLSKNPDGTYKVELDAVPASWCSGVDSDHHQEKKDPIVVGETIISKEFPDGKIYTGVVTGYFDSRYYVEYCEDASTHEYSKRELLQIVRNTPMVQDKASQKNEAKKTAGLESPAVEVLPRPLTRNTVIDLTAPLEEPARGAGGSGRGGAAAEAPLPPRPRRGEPGYSTFFHRLWEQLTAPGVGWTFGKGRGLADWHYFPPGKSEADGSKGQPGEDFYASQGGVEAWAAARRPDLWRRALERAVAREREGALAAGGGGGGGGGGVPAAAGAGAKKRRRPQQPVVVKREPGGGQARRGQGKPRGAVVGQKSKRRRMVVANKKSKYAGVTLRSSRKRRNPWIASIYNPGRQARNKDQGVYLGAFGSDRDAAVAYAIADKELIESGKVEKRDPDKPGNRTTVTRLKLRSGDYEECAQTLHPYHYISSKSFRGNQLGLRENSQGKDAAEGSEVSSEDEPENGNIAERRPSKYVGVLQRGRKWSATIVCKGKQYWLGSYKTEKDAAVAYAIAEKERLKSGKVLIRKSRDCPGDHSAVTKLKLRTGDYEKCAKTVHPYHHASSDGSSSDGTSEDSEEDDEPSDAPESSSEDEGSESDGFVRHATKKTVASTTEYISGSRYSGVHQKPYSWLAEVWHDGEHQTLGTFATEFEAAIVYAIAREEKRDTGKYAQRTPGAPGDRRRISELYLKGGGMEPCPPVVHPYHERPPPRALPPLPKGCFRSAGKNPQRQIKPEKQTKPQNGVKKIEEEKDKETPFTPVFGKREGGVLTYAQAGRCGEEAMAALSQARGLGGRGRDGAAAAGRWDLEYAAGIRGNKRQATQDVAMYGSIFEPLVEALVQELGIQGGRDVFMDVGSGLGQAVAQVAATTGCLSVGIEIDESRAELADAFFKEYLEQVKQLVSKVASERLERLIILELGDFCNFRRKIKNSTAFFINNYGGWWRGDKSHPERHGGGGTPETKFLDICVDMCALGTRVATLERLVVLDAKPGVFRHRSFLAPEGSYSWTDTRTPVHVYTLVSRCWECERPACRSPNAFGAAECYRCRARPHTGHRRARAAHSAAAAAAEGEGR